jgi:hypothetical protein
MTQLDLLTPGRCQQPQHVFVISVPVLQFASDYLMVRMVVRYYAGTGQ